MMNINGLKKYGIDINAVLDWLNGNGEVTKTKDGNAYISDGDYAAIVAGMLAEKKSKYGSVMYDGNEYALTDQAYADNYGNDGRTCYFCNAITGETDEERRLMEYKVRWNTTAEWDKQSEIYRNLFAKKCDAEHGEEPLTEQEDDDLYHAGVYLEDESNACDWDDPADVRLI